MGRIISSFLDRTATTARSSSTSRSGGPDRRTRVDMERGTVRGGRAGHGALGSIYSTRTASPISARCGSDGAPRVHPVAPFIIDGRLYVSTPTASPKARDQLATAARDASAAGKDDDEFAIRGRVAPVTERGEAGAGRARPHWVREDGWIFEYDIEQAHTAHWVNVGQRGHTPSAALRSTRRTRMRM